jgi:hypothetical protein
MTNQKKRVILEHLEGGHHEVTTDEWWMVRLVNLRDGRTTHYLRCKNGRNAKRRKWTLAYDKTFAYRFDSKAEAKRASKCKVIKEVLTGDGLADGRVRETLEIIKVTSRIETIKTLTVRVEERPNCEPLIALAIEASQADDREKDIKRREALRKKYAKSD